MPWIRGIAIGLALKVGKRLFDAAGDQELTQIQAQLSKKLF